MQEEKLAEERTKKREGAPKGQDAAPVNWQPEIEIGTDTLMKADGPFGSGGRRLVLTASQRHEGGGCSGTGHSRGDLTWESCVVPAGAKGWT